MTVLHEPNVHIFHFSQHLTPLYLLYDIVLLSVIMDLEVRHCSEVYGSYVSQENKCMVKQKIYFCFQVGLCAGVPSSTLVGGILQAESSKVNCND